MGACLKPESPDQPPGTYRLDGKLYVRRFAPLRPFDLECRLGHSMRVSHRPIASTPQCDTWQQRPVRRQCSAHLYLYRLSNLRYLSLDITREEADLIHEKRMDIDDVIAHFNLDMPKAA